MGEPAPINNPEDPVYKTIFDNSAVAIMVADAQERLTRWNKLTEFLTGFTSEDLSGKSVASFYPAAEWERLRKEDIRQKGMQHHFETRMIRKDGRAVDVDISITVLKDDKKRITGSIGIIRDITAKKALEEVLRLAKESAEKANKTKGAFLYKLSQEVMEPMGAISSGLAALNSTELSDEQKRVMAGLLASSETLGKMLDELYSIFKELKDEKFLKSE